MTLQHAIPPCIHLRLHIPAPQSALQFFSSNPSTAMYPYALLNLETSVSSQKRPHYSGKLNSKMPGDSKNAFFLHCGDVLLCCSQYMALHAGFGLSTVSWLVFIVTFLSDLSRYSLEQTWLWRFPLVLIAAAQLAQFR